MLAFLWGQQQWFTGNIRNITVGAVSVPLGIKALNKGFVMDGVGLGEEP